MCICLLSYVRFVQSSLIKHSVAIENCYCDRKLLLLDVSPTVNSWLHHCPSEIHSINSLVVQMVKNLPAMQETWVQSLGQEDPLEKGMATHSSVLVWRIPWTKEPGGLVSMRSQRVGHDHTTKHSGFLVFTWPWELVWLQISRTISRIRVQKV